MVSSTTVYLGCPNVCQDNAEHRDVRNEENRSNNEEFENDKRIALIFEIKLVRHTETTKLRIARILSQGDEHRK